MEKLPDNVKGYPKLSVLFGKFPHVACYRKFSSLAHRILLYDQARITYLESYLHELEKADSVSQDDNRRRYAMDWTYLEGLHGEGQGMQRYLVGKIRAALSEYYDLLLKHKAVTAIPQPLDCDRRFLQEWLVHQDGNDVSLQGRDAAAYGTMENPESFAEDLAVGMARADAGPFLNWIVDSFTSFFHRQIVERFPRLKIKQMASQDNVIAYNGSTVRIASVFATSIPSLILCSSIAILYSVNSTPKRLGLLACFCIIYSICLGYFSRPQGGEIFSSVTTYAALAVVFVAASLPSGNGTATA
ncbi:hypothetical protein EV356DRAFT_152962 [Viridothelium virens]|uniref:DUF6594 domain-containing protein n=1 Tax=Viridothelium virens TaxID=1048519 RepID=A0A6A6H9E4_VIRVR|nr:hypothetical protein EV356DRAFT_152962 [Viridothelium virens]